MARTAELNRLCGPAVRCFAAIATGFLDLKLFCEGSTRKLGFVVWRESCLPWTDLRMILIGFTKHNATDLH